MWVGAAIGAVAGSPRSPAGPGRERRPPQQVEGRSVGVVPAAPQNTYHQPARPKSSGPRRGPALIRPRAWDPKAARHQALTIL